MSALADMLGQPVADAVTPLSDASRRQITALAERLLDLNLRLESDEIGNLAEVALATGQRDLRAEVERLATDGAAWTNHGVVSSFSIELGQRILQARLKKLSKP